MYKIEPLEPDSKKADIINKVNEIITFINGSPQLRLADEEKLVDINETARILDVHPETLRRWDNDGKFKAVRKGGNKERMYRLTDIVKALDKQIEEDE